jgi:hypothetical protein
MMRTLWRVGLMLGLVMAAAALAAPDAGPFPLLLIGAVTPTTMVELNDLAKDYFSDVYQPQFNPDTALSAQIMKAEDAQFTGRKWIHGIKLGLGGGSSNAGANKTLPPASQGQFDQGESTLVRTYTRMSLDGLAIEVTKKRAGSYRPALAEVMADRLTAHDLEVNRQLFCGGDGKLALVGGTPGASATQTLAHDYGITGGGLGTRHVFIDDILAFYQTNGTLIARKTVTDVDHAAGTVDLDSSVTTTATTDFVSKSTSDDDNFTAGEAQGLLKGIAAGALEGITHPVWEGLVNDNGGVARTITDGMVLSILAQVRAKSKRVPNIAVTRPGVILKYSEIFLPIRRIDGQATQLVGGYKPIAEMIHGGGTIPVVEDLDCPNGRIGFVHTESLRKADLVGTEWADMDGAQFDRVTDKDAIEGYIRKYWQVIWIQRNTHAWLADVEDIPEIERRAA